MLQVAEWPWDAGSFLLPVKEILLPKSLTNFQVIRVCFKRLQHYILRYWNFQCTVTNYGDNLCIILPPSHFTRRNFFFDGVPNYRAYHVLSSFLPHDALLLCMHLTLGYPHATNPTINRLVKPYTFAGEGRRIGQGHLDLIYMHAWVMGRGAMGVICMLD